MYLSYGNVTLRVIDLTRFERETVWTEDGADLLYIRTTLGVTATYGSGGNPVLPSVSEVSEDARRTLAGGDTTRTDVIGNPRGLNPGERAPILPEPKFETIGNQGLPGIAHTGPETDAELRARLWGPRQKLILWAYEREGGNPIRWLESPRSTFATDCNNGPRPLSVDVVSASGEPNSIAVHFQVQTDMSPCPIGSDRLVLSHRWQMSHSHDENYYLTRTIEGTIVFNRAVLDSTILYPDFVRAQFIHPIPLGFRRNAPQVTLSSDGLTIHYVVTDTDPSITFDPGNSGATSIQIVERLVNTVGRGTGGPG